MGKLPGNLTWLLVSGFFVIISSACDKSSFSGQAQSGNAPVVTAPVADGEANPNTDTVVNNAPVEAIPKAVVGGIPGGHFDLDTAIASYAFNQGKTVAHVHEYDDKFGVTGVDFFKLLDTKFVEPIEVLTPDQTFKIIVANAQLSPGARISINGQTYLATDWQKRSASGDLPIYSLSGAAGTQKLLSLTVTFDSTKSIDGQLVPTETGPVQANVPGPGQTYRNGALTLQMIDSKIGVIDPTLGVSKIGAPGMLWESTLFWHFNKSSD